MRTWLILRVGLGVVLAIAALVELTPISVWAAMVATLSSSHARPGDSVLLLTDDIKGAATYERLSLENHQNIYLAPTTGDWGSACGGAGSQMLGKLQWRGNAGGLAFVVPNLPQADYWLFMQTMGQCWRIGHAIGRLWEPLVLSIGQIPAENQDLAANWTVDSLPLPKRSPGKPVPISSSTVPTNMWLVILGVSAVLVIALSVSRWRATKDGQR